MTNPKQNKKVPQEILEDREALTKLLVAWNPCHQLELEAAVELMYTGMEARPLHAIERAHVVLVAIGAIADYPEEP